MRLATWNVNSLMARLPASASSSASTRPTWCLQETECEPDAFPHEALAEAGYHAIHHSTSELGISTCWPATST